MKKIFHLLTIGFLMLTMCSYEAVTAAKAVDCESQKVILGGNPFGVKMFSDGVMVVKTESFLTADGQCCPAEDAGIKPNDIIITARGEYLESNEQLSEIIESSNGENISLTIKRDGKQINTTLVPRISTDGIYRAGMWVKDSAAGIGTVTFYSEELDGFCALGHGICDTDTGELIPIAFGDVDEACVSSVTKSADGNVGTLNGYFTNKDIGTANTNCNKGIYGELDTEDVCGKEIEIAEESEITTGNAYIFTTVYGNKPKAYEAKIVKLTPHEETVNMVIKIVDEELLQITGGIVQGMSGSPIVQNGKLVGAVTHVIVDNVDHGYGIFAETMLEELKETCN